eukprot:4994344-Prymnesium_polylepis.1
MVGATPCPTVPGRGCRNNGTVLGSRKSTLPIPFRFDKPYPYATSRVSAWGLRSALPGDRRAPAPLGQASALEETRPRTGRWQRCTAPTRHGPSEGPSCDETRVSPVPSGSAPRRDTTYQNAETT